jgi:hypothetical protein
VGGGGGGGVAQIRRNEILPSMGILRTGNNYVQVSQRQYSLHQCHNRKTFHRFFGDVLVFPEQGDVMNLTHFANRYCCPWQVKAIISVLHERRLSFSFTHEICYEVIQYSQNSCTPMAYYTRPRDTFMHKYTNSDYKL